ncbi:hypothetical protein [Acinetobacter baumannii]|uniref:hypothetical protein n=1 Tax=Acinetobacter baumannii TaxID=470 RepID=UPI00148766FE|nr:hypothetical protein [Acinetobacter baumannii]
MVGARSAGQERPEANGGEGQEARRPRRPQGRRDRTDAGQRHAAARDTDRVRHQSGQGGGQPV